MTIWENIIKKFARDFAWKLNPSNGFTRFISQNNLNKNFLKLFIVKSLCLTNKAACIILSGMTKLMYCLKEALKFWGLAITLICGNHIRMRHERPLKKVQPIRLARKRRCLFRKETKFYSLNINTNYLWIIIKNTFVYHPVVIRT